MSFDAPCKVRNDLEGGGISIINRPEALDWIASQSISLDDSSEGGHDLLGRADAGKKREDLFKREALLLLILCSASIFDKPRMQSRDLN
jgi:hypothetical protein